MMVPGILSEKDLIDIIEDIEWEDFEVKEARSDIPKSSWETVSAFSNTSGGWLIFGVRKDGKKFEITGISDPERIEQNFTTNLRNGSKFNKVINVISRKFDIDGKTVLAFYIPRRYARDKPVYFNSLKNTFIRTGSGDQRATLEEIDSFLRASSMENPDVEKTDLSIDDLDTKTIERYRNYFANINPGHRFNTLNDNAFLHKIGALSDNRVTYAGLLVMGTEDAISRTLPHYKIEYLEIPGISYEDGPTRYNYRISSEQNLFSTFFDINERLMRKIEIPFSVIGGIRDEDPPQAQAIREALVNMLIHSDHSSRMNPRIRVFSDRIEFLNPGPLPKRIEDILKEDLSIPRNPTITKMFRYVKLAENIGSGFHKMINGWLNHYNKEPLIESDLDHYGIIFQLARIKASEGIDTATQKTDQKTDQKTTPMQTAIIEYLKLHPHAGRKELSENVPGISESGIKYNLKRLQEMGMLKRIGPAKGGHWEVIL